MEGFKSMDEVRKDGIYTVVLKDLNNNTFFHSCSSYDGKIFDCVIVSGKRRYIEILPSTVHEVLIDSYQPFDGM